MRVIQLHPGYDEPTDLVRNLRFRPDGHAVAAVLGDVGSGHAVAWYDLARDANVAVHLPEDDDELREWSPDPAVSPSLELVARLAHDEELQASIRLTDTWAKPAENVELPWTPRGRSVLALGFSPEDVLFVGGSVTQNAAVIAPWDAEAIFSGKDPDAAELELLRLPADFFPSAFAFAPDKFGMAVGTFEGITLFIDRRRPYEWQSLRHTPQRSHGKPLYAVAYSPDGRYFLSRDRTSLSVWDLPKRLQLKHWPELAALTDAAFSPDCRTLATANADGTVIVYDLETLTEQTRYDWQQGPLHAIAFAPDGLTAAAGATRGRVVLWDL